MYLCILFNIMFNNHHKDVYEANILEGTNILD